MPKNLGDCLSRPLGIFLPGGAALGAWQAGALETLSKNGVIFDEIMGFSIGAVNGSSLAFGRIDSLLQKWRTIDGGILRPRPRLCPPSLFSNEALRELLADQGDGPADKAALRIPLTVASSCPALSSVVYARFTPRGKDGWDAPLNDHIVASCSVPWIFPPVDIRIKDRSLRLVDGVVPQRAPMRLDALSHCASIVVLEFCSVAEKNVRFWNPWYSIDRDFRLSCRALTDSAVGALLRGKNPPRIYRVAPSVRIAPVQLDFSARAIRQHIPLGASDALAFLSNTESYRVKDSQLPSD